MSDLASHVLVIGHDPAFLRAVHDALNTADAAITTVLAKSHLSVLRDISAANLPKLVLARWEAANNGGFEDLSAFSHRFPGVPVVLVCEKKDADLMVGALHAGVREFLFEPLQAADVRATVQRLIGGLERSHTPGTAMVEVFIPCKGGSGATFLAANLAHVLAESRHKRVLLLDLNLQFGDAYLFLMDQLPAVTLADVCIGIDRLDAAFLESATAKLPSGLHVLAAPPSPEDSEVVKPDHVARIIGLARTQYDFVLIDVNRSFDAVTLKALDLADHIYPILQLDLPYVRHAKRMKELFTGLGYGPGKIRWVVNRYIGKEDVALTDAERLLADAFWTVPNDHRSAIGSVNQGIPVSRLKARSVVAKSLAEWAAHLTPQASEQRSWFRFLRHTPENESGSTLA